MRRNFAIKRLDPMRILVLSPIVPFPPASGGALRTYHLLRHLASQFEVTLIGFTWSENELTQTPDPSFAIEVIPVPWEEPALYREMNQGGEAATRAINALETCAEPWFVSYYDSPAFEAALRRVTHERAFDLFLIEHTFMARFLSVLPESTPKILNLHNVHSLIAQREAARKPDVEKTKAEREAARTLTFEKAACAKAELCLTCSPNEADAAKRLLDVRSVAVVPNGVDTSNFNPSGNEPAPGYLLFTGMMNYEPNVEAARFFAREIFPKIVSEMPGAQFHIVGANPTKEVKQLASETIIVRGAVPDTRLFFREAAVVVVPLLQGGGTRLKILEAAASGKAIVSTSLGAEGLDFQPGRDLLIADTPEEFAQTVVELLLHPESRRALEACSRAASLRYDWENIGSALGVALARWVKNKA